MTEKIHNVVIVGTGPAGLTSAIYTARANLEPIIYAGMQHGGQLTITTDVENWPGFENGILGPKLMQDMTAQAERFGTKIEYDLITKVDLEGPIKTLWAGDKEIKARTVIISTGATARTLGLEGEAELMGKGLSTCATCDGFFYRNKKVAVVGGGDSAMEEATYLAKLCSEVILIHRRDVFRASPIMLKRAQNEEKITFKVPYDTVETVADSNGLTAVKIKNLETNEVETIELDGLFYAIGHTPNSQIFKDFVDVDDHGYIKVSEFTKTKTPGVFAAGDIADPHFKQAITAAGMGCQAAIQAQHYIENLD
ncbi:MAG: thioredoxin-disulfide reductase [Pseudobacteriovorax sp.]|nr:thioredoxin-disulfide reductase [Pseudobacteriovorax sp.]